MLYRALAVVGLATGASALQVGVAARAPHTVSPQMADISAFDNIWGIEAKIAIYDQWDPEKPRDYNNFNPFERNDDGAKADSNGCFPGESRGYQPPNRPDVNFAKMKVEKEMLAELAKDPKWGLKGKAGCYSMKWQDKLGAPP